jgi:class 3 adenylate cyclase
VAPALPTGTVTFLLTDVEGSSRLWEAHPEAMRAALARHDALVEALTERHGGCVVRPRGEGDSRFAVFARATDALAAALAVQRALHAEPWPTPEPLRVRMALHTGEADLRDGDYYGSAVNRCARLRDVAHGGQVLLSATVRDLAAGNLPADAALRDLGAHRLRDLGEPERVFQLLGAGLPDGFWAAVTRDGMCADDADPAGIYFGSRTGEVYASRDEGDSWQRIVQHLPDVLCVRAATV